MKRNNSPENDEYWIRQCLKLAKKAQAAGEVPVAAVVVDKNGLVSWAMNARERKTSVLGHAELLALHQASQKRKSWRLEDCTLYVSLEPCVMCSGAIQQARLSRVVFGALDPKAGGSRSVYQILNDERLNHQCEITGPLLEKECSDLLKDFFGQKRQEQKKMGLEFRERSSAVIVHENKILTFRAIDPTSGKEYFFLPGGKVEANENPMDCATRETLEETGYDVELLPETELEKKYAFHWDGHQWNCRTQFYLGRLKSWHEPKPVPDADYNKGPVWIPIKNIAQVFNYNVEILAAVQKLLKKAHLLRDFKKNKWLD